MGLSPGFETVTSEALAGAVPLVGATELLVPEGGHGVLDNAGGVGEHLLEGTVKDDLLQSLKANDNSNCGACPRDDFINSVFDNVRGVKASDLMKLLSTFADEYEELVSFDDFIRLVERQG